MTDRTNVFGSASYLNNHLKDLGDATYDMQAKEVLSFRIILANILKYSIEEFRRYDVQDLAEMIPKDKDNPLRAQLKNNTDKQGDLTTIEFDVYTTAVMPTGIEIYLDFEAQRRLRPTVKNSGGKSATYSIAKRAVYYASRMLSSQLRTGNNNYECLKRCYSIWLLFNPDNHKPQVMSYRMLPDTEPDMFSDELAEEYSKDIDLLRVILIALDTEGISQEPLQEFLSAVFFKKLNSLSRFIPDSSTYDFVYKEVSSMCNLREVYEDIYTAKGVQEGRAQGLEEGRAEGRAEGELDILVRYAKSQILRGSPKDTVIADLRDLLLATEEQANKAYAKALAE